MVGEIVTTPHFLLMNQYLRKGPRGYFLEPANAKYKPIYPENTLNIEAVVTAVVRKY